MSTETLFEFATVPGSMSIPQDLLQALLEERITGILVKGFLNEAEVNSVRSGLLSLPNEVKTKVDDGFTSYPLSFAQFTQMRASGQMTNDDYVEIASNLLESQTAHFGLNLVERLCSYLELTPPFGSVKPIFNLEKGKPLVPYNFRELYPGNGELIAHCENLFFEEFPEFFKWLKLMDIVDNKLSYFITLQEAELGGELCCFDLHWSSVKKRHSPTIVGEEDGTLHDLNLDDGVERQLIKPQEGDLLLFAGGNVWHRVETVRGLKSRITVGGFIAETSKPGTYYIWS